MNTFYKPTEGGELSSATWGDVVDFQKHPQVVKGAFMNTIVFFFLQTTRKVVYSARIETVGDYDFKTTCVMAN